MNPGTSKPYRLGDPLHIAPAPGLSLCGVRALMLIRIRDSGLSRHKWALGHGLYPTEVSEFLRGMRPASTKLLDALGLVKLTMYVRATEVKNVVEPMSAPCHNGDGHTS